MPGESNPSLDGLPDEIVTYIRNLRSESANYRTQRNEYRDKYTDAGQLLATANTKLDGLSAVEDQVETLAKANASLTTNHDKLRAAAKFGIPDEVDRLKGSTFDEWEADAKDLSEKLGKPVGNRTPKDEAAGERPKTDEIEDPILKAFRDAGVM